MIEIAGGIVLAVLFLALLPYLPLLLLFALCGVVIIAGVVLAIGLVVAAPLPILVVLSPLWLALVLLGCDAAARRLRAWWHAEQNRELAAAEERRRLQRLAQLDVDYRGRLERLGLNERRYETD